MTWLTLNGIGEIVQVTAHSERLNYLRERL